VAVTRVGYVGLGNIGGPIARRLHEAGFDVAVWARRSVSVGPLAVCSSLVELAQRSDLLGICVLDDLAVLDVLTHDIISVMPRGAVIVIQSTVLPSTCEAVASIAQPCGINVIDAPVSGGSDGAARGELSLPVGGDADAVAKCSAMLEALGTYRYLGGLGSGQVTKICSNVLYSTHLGVALAAIEAGEAMGADPAALRSVLETTTARSFVIGRIPRLTRASTFEHSVGLLAKDRALFDRLCAEQGYDGSVLSNQAAHGLVALAEWVGRSWDA
jgi:3-hydroxyisobutyrate dehydrogenase